LNEPIDFIAIIKKLESEKDHFSSIAKRYTNSTQIAVIDKILNILELIGYDDNTRNQSEQNKTKKTLFTISFQKHNSSYKVVFRNIPPFKNFNENLMYVLTSIDVLLSPLKKANPTEKNKCCSFLQDFYKIIDHILFMCEEKKILAIGQSRTNDLINYRREIKKFEDTINSDQSQRQVIKPYYADNANIRLTDHDISPYNYASEHELRKEIADLKDQLKQDGEKDKEITNLKNKLEQVYENKNIAINELNNQLDQAKKEKDIEIKDLKKQLEQVYENKSIEINALKEQLGQAKKEKDSVITDLETQLIQSKNKITDLTERLKQAEDTDGKIKDINKIINIFEDNKYLKELYLFLNSTENYTNPSKLKQFIVNSDEDKIGELSRFLIEEHNGSDINNVFFNNMKAKLNKAGIYPLDLTKDALTETQYKEIKKEHSLDGMIDMQEQDCSNKDKDNTYKFVGDCIVFHNSDINCYQPASKVKVNHYTFKLSFSGWLKEQKDINDLFNLMNEMNIPDSNDEEARKIFENWIRTNNFLSYKNFENLENEFQQEENTDILFEKYHAKVNESEQWEWKKLWGKLIERILSLFSSYKDFDEAFINCTDYNKYYNILKSETRYNFSLQEDKTHTEISKVISKGKFRKENGKNIVFRKCEIEAVIYQRPSALEGYEIIVKFFRKLKENSTNINDNTINSIINQLETKKKQTNIVYEIESVHNDKELINLAKKNKIALHRIIESEKDAESIFQEKIIDKVINDIDEPELKELNVFKKYFKEEWKILKDKLHQMGIGELDIRSKIEKKGEILPDPEQGEKCKDDWDRYAYTGDIKGDYKTVAEVMTYGIQVKGELLIPPKVTIF